MIEIIANGFNWIIGNIVVWVFNNIKAAIAIFMIIVLLEVAVIIYYGIQDYRDRKEWEEINEKFK